MAKKDRCGRVKRSDALVVWNDPHNPKGNVQKVLAHGLANNTVRHGICITSRVNDATYFSIRCYDL